MDPKLVTLLEFNEASHSIGDIEWCNEVNDNNPHVWIPESNTKDKQSSKCRPLVFHLSLISFVYTRL